MKITEHILIVLMAVLIAAAFDRCTVMKDVDDQSPKLMVDVDISGLTLGPTVIDDQHPICLIYYNKQNWTEPWLQHGAAATFLFNPTVLNINTYVAVFWDKNGNGVLDTGDPYDGYANVDKTGTLTIVPFLPSQITHLNLTLTDTRIW